MHRKSFEYLTLICFCLCVLTPPCSLSLFVRYHSLLINGAQFKHFVCVSLFSALFKIGAHLGKCENVKIFFRTISLKSSIIYFGRTSHNEYKTKSDYGTTLTIHQVSRRWQNGFFVSYLWIQMEWIGECDFIFIREIKYLVNILLCKIYDCHIHTRTHKRFIIILYSYVKSLCKVEGSEHTGICGWFGFGYPLKWNDYKYIMHIFTWAIRFESYNLHSCTFNGVAFFPKWFLFQPFVSNFQKPKSGINIYHRKI